MGNFAYRDAGGWQFAAFVATVRMDPFCWSQLAWVHIYNYGHPRDPIRII